MVLLGKSSTQFKKRCDLKFLRTGYKLFWNIKEMKEPKFSNKQAKPFYEYEKELKESRKEDKMKRERRKAKRKEWE